MNKQILIELEQRITQALGSLSLVMGHGEDDEVFLTSSKAELIGLIHGLRNLIAHLPSEAMTLGELEKAQFDRAIDVRSDRPAIQALMDENINNEFLNDMEHDATWGN